MRSSVLAGLYVCHNGNFLCPIIAGEPLSYCNGACYSTFMYTCSGGALAQLPRLEGAFTLTVSNPKIEADGWPVTACSQHLWIGGETCSYCPAETVGEENCPPGNVTALYAPSGLATMVPGGQQYYLDPYWFVGYTQAHSASIPSGSTVGGFAAFENGGFVNLNEGALGWVACYPTASGGGDGRWTLSARNETNANVGQGCFAVNLKVTPAEAPAAWQYT
ncbi:hypothetical protein jhhlp_002877 [Lomentospora prolificans]|uniref:Endo-1,3(4)-beta-glucanase 1 carbohydrate binding domain-containing protein n=1 Tax=Lomentospora prolificans TaxID=41688 RepID=A0A2N3NF58_9PEZI|nr:hypothetical protein jhhlp_002877 [Lomentospora prolificans]